MEIKRRKSRVIKIGDCLIGGNNPVAIQSMAKTKTSDIEETVRQIKGLEKAGCEIVRLAVKDDADARAIRKIRAGTNLPLVADIHFDWRLAMVAIESGVDKVRLNPGNIFRKAQIAEIVSAAKLARIPIRVGVNSGSVHSARSARGGRVSVEAMVRSGRDYIKILEGLKFKDIVVSLKASNVPDTIAAYRKIAEFCDYPLHLGVTATGSAFLGAIKSSIAIGTLLSEGIGDTIRVSLTDKPEREVFAAKGILESLQLRRFGPQIISCPTCGRCEVDLVKIVEELEERLSTMPACLPARQGPLTRPLKIAIMGCVVNGPGEAKEADIGIAFGRKEGVLFKSGKPVRKVSTGECVDILLKELGT
jgi:(E)-4-hydroxy-3-methylbut-2-enyl-diphosphate synthase